MKPFQFHSIILFEYSALFHSLIIMVCYALVKKSICFGYENICFQYILCFRLSHRPDQCAFLPR